MAKLDYLPDTVWWQRSRRVRVRNNAPGVFDDSLLSASGVDEKRTMCVGVEKERLLVRRDPAVDGSGGLKILPGIGAICRWVE
jgi:hypothetical protein